MEPEAENIIIPTPIPFSSLNSGDAFERPAELIHGPYPSRNVHPMMLPWVPLAGIILYLLLKPILETLCDKSKTNGKSKTFRALALAHNLFLCFYSGWTSYNCTKLVYTFTKAHGIDGLYCNPKLWEEGLKVYGFLFYLSKYYELFDTALLIVKRRRVIYLQTYHHAATIYGAYLLVVTHASVTFIFVVFNSTVHTVSHPFLSFIHLLNKQKNYYGKISNLGNLLWNTTICYLYLPQQIMYFYYALSILRIRIPGKSLITSLQMVQFFVGIVLAFPIYVLRRGRCGNSIQYLAVVALMAHVGYLLVLFVRFYKQRYLRKKVS